MAGPADGFGELMEQLARAYEVVSTDRSSVAGSSDAGRRALDLMAGLLGVTEAEDPSPATLLRPGNLALGVVAADAEAAAEALAKFWEVGVPVAAARVETVSTPGRTRIAAPGEISVVATAVELAYGGDEAASMVVAELLRERAANVMPDADVRVLRPYVPGRAILVLEVAMTGSVSDVEGELDDAWSRLVARVGEDELVPVRRRVAALASAAMSGVSGHARHCAATAAGASRWRQPGEFELEVLSVAPDTVGGLLAELPAWADLLSTAAGVLPITEVGSP
jgi:hypothetical protein